MPVTCCCLIAGAVALDRAFKFDQDMPRAERKRHYAAIGRRLRRDDVNPALLAKYAAMKSDAERPLACTPSLMHTWFGNPYISMCSLFEV